MHSTTSSHPYRLSSVLALSLVLIGSTTLRAQLPSAAGPTSPPPAAPSTAPPTAPPNSPEFRARVERLIERLGDPKFAEREEATKELRVIGTSTRGLLEQALKHDDREIAPRR